MRIVFMRPMNAIALDHVTKRFGTHLAVDDLSLDVPDRFGLRLHRSERVGQDDDDPDDPAHPAARSRANRSVRRRTNRPRARQNRLFTRGTRALQEDEGPAPAAATTVDLRVSHCQISTKALIGGLTKWTCARGWTNRSRRSRRAWRRRSSSSRLSWREPDLLILDEPFSGLDPVNAEVLQGRGARRPPRRHDRRLQHARHERGRADVRPHLHDLPGQQGARRDAGRDPGRLRRRHGPSAGGRAAPGPAYAAGRDERQRLRTAAGSALRRPAGPAGGAGGARVRAALRGHPAVAARHLRSHRPAPGGRARRRRRSDA